MTEAHPGQVEELVDHPAHALGAGHHPAHRGSELLVLGPGRDQTGGSDDCAMVVESQTVIEALRLIRRAMPSIERLRFRID